MRSSRRLTSSASVPGAAPASVKPAPPGAAAAAIPPALPSTGNHTGKRHLVPLIALAIAYRRLGKPQDAAAVLSSLAKLNEEERQRESRAPTRLVKQDPPPTP